MIKTKNLTGAQAVTANRLRDGAVVFLTPEGAWSHDIARSRVVEDASEAQRLLELGARAVAERVVVAPYLIEVAADGGPIAPVTYRERIRAFGPSVAPPAA